jgi:hypothetical protein
VIVRNKQVNNYYLSIKNLLSGIKNPTDKKSIKSTMETVTTKVGPLKKPIGDTEYSNESSGKR